MKKLINFLTGVLVFIGMMILLMIPVLNIVILYRSNQQTIDKWIQRNQLLYMFGSNNILIKICNGHGKEIIYDSALWLLKLDTSEKAKLILNTPIKYIDVKDNKLVVQLWNTTKINKFYGIKTKGE